MTNINDYLTKFGPLINTKTGEEQEFTSFKYQYLGLYFTADWCTYCVKLIDKLPHLIRKVNSQGEKLKLITLRLDESPTSFAYNYYKFKQITYEESSMLASLIGARGLPSIFIFNYAGKFISSNGLNQIMKHQEGTIDYWDSKNNKET